MNKTIDLNKSEPSFQIMSGYALMFELIHPEAKLPERAEYGSSGYDLRSVEAMIIDAGEFKLVPTGLKWQPAAMDVEMQIRPRSGLAAKHGVTVLNSPGTVDSSFRNEIKVILINHGKFPFKIEVGDRIAQAVFARIDKSFTLDTVISVNETERKGGFGSTGVK